MIFIFGISDGHKELDHHQPIICDRCGRYGKYMVFVEYMFFSLFFIPVFKWNKTYYAKASCCGTIYKIDNETGKAIEKGQNVTIRRENLHDVYRGQHMVLKKCSQCGYTTNEDFQYCPKCAHSLDDL
ncbi:MAG: zinc ribbon domain-containing protein [Caldicoprobacterales bacterium]|jgi:heterodisulfide reductase subunit B|nr:zinc ribbon domain-containing protein [Clostridiales bacterium]